MSAALPSVHEGLSKQELALAGLISVLDLCEHLTVCDWITVDRTARTVVWEDGQQRMGDCPIDGKLY